jgi:hypothetical protein
MSVSDQRFAVMPAFCELVMEGVEKDIRVGG